MIVVRLEGGLGNQLFQYAYGMQLAQRHRSELVLDLSSYTKRPKHGYMLDRFCVSARALQSYERKRLPLRDQGMSPPGRHVAWWQRAMGLNWRDDALTRIRERPFGFSAKYLRAPDDSYLVGYWQSEKFFPDVQSHVREQFCPRDPLSAQSLRIHDRMLTTTSIALHVRRGDYVTDRAAASIYRHLSVDYYRDSVLALLERYPGAEAYVFSNDMAWCREVLSLPCPTHFVDHTSGSLAHEDLWMMTAAQCLVIANSTFSWWGAWLGTRDGKHVMAPQHWFQPRTLSERSLLCGDWELRTDSRSTRLLAAA